MSTCTGCGATLLRENAWMEDGCPCNSFKGCNNGNQHISEWRSELLQAERDSRAADAAEIERLKAENAELKSDITAKAEAAAKEIMTNRDWAFLDDPARGLTEIITREFGGTK